MTRDEILITLTATGLRAGLQQTALADYLRRGLERFPLDEAPQADVEAWITTTKTDAPHLFSASPARQRSTSPVPPEYAGFSAAERAARYRAAPSKVQRPTRFLQSPEQVTAGAGLSLTQRITRHRQLRDGQA